MATPAEIEARFLEWVHEYRLVFWKIARAFAVEAADQADLVQDMQFHLWNALPRFRGESKTSTWIYRVCLNTALTWRRSAVRRAADKHDPLDATNSVANPAPDPGADAEPRDMPNASTARFAHSWRRIARSCCCNSTA